MPLRRSLVSFGLACGAVVSASADVVQHGNRSDLEAAAGPGLAREAWESIPNGTVIQDQTINGITYRHTNAFGNTLLAVNNGGAWGMRFGLLRSDGATGFGWSNRVTFVFTEPLCAFGITFVQGTFNRFGQSDFAVQVDDGPVYICSVPVTRAGPNAGYIGLSGLEQATSISVWGGGGGDSVWGIYNIDYRHCATCAADVNNDGGVDAGDIEWFFGAWSAGIGAADLNLDGGIDGQDLFTFFESWQVGC